MRRRGTALLLGVVLLGAAVAARGSERSELLAARAQAAYHARRYDEARALFAEAAAADPKDPAAHYGLGLALARVGRSEEARAAFDQALRIRPDFPEARRARDLAAQARALVAEEAPAPAPKRWEIRASAGAGYDSNVKLDPHTRGLGKRDDATFYLATGGHLDVVRLERAIVRLDYDFYQTLHPHLDDFDFRSHLVSGAAGYAVRPWLWAGVQGGYDHATLGSDPYVQEPFVLPYVSFSERRRGVTQVFYRHGEEEYLSAPFEDVRDGPLDTVGIDQRINLDDGGTRYLLVGYEFQRENPDSSAGDDYDRLSNQVHLGVGFSVWWRTAVELLYAYRNDDYREPNSLAGFRRTRADNEHHFLASAKRELTEHLNVQLGYNGTVNTSNIGVFDYRRNIVSLLFEVVY